MPQESRRSTSKYKLLLFLLVCKIVILGPMESFGEIEIIDKLKKRTQSAQVITS